MRRSEELLEGFLAGTLSPEEEREFAALLAREDHRRLFEAHRETALLLGRLARGSPSPSFCEEVLARLPERRAGLRERIWQALWAPRALRWNLASALALVLLLAGAPLVWKAVHVEAPAPARPRLAITLVRFSLYAPKAERVSLAGDFNGWRTDEIFLSDATGRGHFSATIPLQPGRYAYMFVVDGRIWVTDPEAEAYREDGFGHSNALVRVKEGERENGDA